MAIVCILVIIIGVSFWENAKNLQTIQKENKELEDYQNRMLYGTDVLSLINKVDSINKKNEIPKDNDGKYIANDTNSVIMEIQLLNEGKLVSYSMESLQKAGTDKFIQGFNLTAFRLTKMEYHSTTKKVAKLTVVQLEE